MAKTIKLFNLKIYAGSKSELTSELQTQILGKNLKLVKVFTPNPEQIVQAQGNDQFLADLKKADYLLPDGIGLIKASQILRLFDRQTDSLAKNITGVAVVEEILAFAKQKKLPALIIGGRDYQKKLTSNLHWTEAYLRKEKILPEEEQRLLNLIKKLQPKIVFVALGAPAQERWVLAHEKFLKDNGVRIAMVTGGAFDFIFGKVKRAPREWREWGLEWLYRLIQQPWRAKRQLRLLKFISLTLRELLN